MNTLERLLWLRLQHFVARYGERVRFPLTDLEAALLTAMSEAPKFGVPLNQRGLARLLRTSETVVSERLKWLKHKGLCRITKVPKKGRVPVVTMKGKASLLKYAKVRFSGTAWSYPHLAELAQFTLMGKAYEAYVTGEIGNKLNELKDV